MEQRDFIKHACEQVLRFTKANEWGDLSQELKVQLGFNMGALSLGLNLSKEEGFLALANAREGKISMADFNKHIRAIVDTHGVIVDEEKVNRAF